MTEPTSQQILDFPLDPNQNGAGASSIREYLKALLTELWREEECFSPKRPFGNSGAWQHDVYDPMARAGWLKTETENYGDEVQVFMDWYERPKAEGMILEAIKAL